MGGTFPIHPAFWRGTGACRVRARSTALLAHPPRVTGAMSGIQSKLRCFTCGRDRRRRSAVDRSRGRGPDAGRTTGFKETDADRTRARPFLPGRASTRLRTSSRVSSPPPAYRSGRHRACRSSAPRSTRRTRAEVRPHQAGLCGATWLRHLIEYCTTLHCTALH
eukprot:gene13512-biopygen17034